MTDINTKDEYQLIDYKRLALATLLSLLPIFIAWLLG